MTLTIRTVVKRNYIITVTDQTEADRICSELMSGQTDTALLVDLHDAAIIEKNESLQSADTDDGRFYNLTLTE